MSTKKIPARPQGELNPLSLTINFRLSEEILMTSRFSGRRRVYTVLERPWMVNYEEGNSLSK